MENEGKGGRKAKLSSYLLASECAALPQSQAAGFNYQYLKVKKPMKKLKTDHLRRDPNPVPSRLDLPLI
jgi:hypothetical protein